MITLSHESALKCTSAFLSNAISLFSGRLLIDFEPANLNKMLFQDRGLFNWMPSDVHLKYITLTMSTETA